jgi:hypothetical protein
MRKSQLLSILIFVLIGAIPSYGTTQQFTKHDWTFLVDARQGSLSIRHAQLGVVIEEAVLNLQNEDRLTRLSGWNVVDEGTDHLAVTTSHPVALTWEFVVAPNEIAVHSSAANSVIAGIAPAPDSRFPARIADPDKMQSFLSDENTDYTGAKLYERMYVPGEASHVMYLALGLVEARNLHALFDRPSDTVIQFSAKSGLKRNLKSPTQMEVSIPVNKGTVLVKLVPDYFTKVLGLPRYVPYDDTYHKTAPTGWNHWLAFFRQVTEQDIVNATDWVAANLKGYGMTHIQLDDGYDHVEHRHWNKDWDPRTFPHGPTWLANYIKSKGFTPGLWTVPYSYCAQHGKPEWFLRDEKGKVVMDYQGGGELDFSREEVIRDYWIPLFRSLKAQGWEYYKFDMGNTVQMWEKYKERFYDQTKTPYDVSLRTMKVFREIMGPEVWHTNHPDNSGGRMGFIDVAGCGRDPGPGWAQINNFFEVISNNTYQNHIVWYSDPDCIVLRGKPTRADAAEGNREFLSMEEARTAASLLSLAGLQWLSGDDLPNLESERVELIKKCIPILPIFPIDLFGRGRDKKDYPAILDLKVNMPSGIYDVITVTNWSNRPDTRSVSFEKDLALDPELAYLVFDFWNQALLGEFRGEFKVDVPVHGTRVFTIRRLLDRPQLLATNRHITSAFSIQKQTWNSSSQTLSGISQTVPGAQYSLFIHVPSSLTVGKVQASAKDVTHNIEPGRLLRISFLGQRTPADWSVTFAGLR